MITKTWAARVLETVTSLGWNVCKSDVDGRWEILEGSKVMRHARTMGDVLHLIGIDLEIE